MLFCQPVMQGAMVGNVFLAPTVLNEACTIYSVHVLYTETQESGTQSGL